VIANSVIPLLANALAARAELFDLKHEAAIRLFNGFAEGCADLVVELYGRTLVFHNQAERPESARPLIHAAQDYLLARLSWVQSVMVKTRHAPTLEEKRGLLTHGATPDRWMREHGVRYAIDLQLNRDPSLYLDTRNLREWAIGHLGGKTVLNTFAYTGSLGVAAMAGKAARVVQLDRNRTFLNIAKTSYTLNGFPIHKSDFVAQDFWPYVSRLRRSGEGFDCVFVDPPFFSLTDKGRVDLVNNSARVINKVRSLVKDGGWLVAINNALFVSGMDYMRTLETLCADGYLSIEALIPVPPDCTGYPQTTVTPPLVDPAPFNHSTKIAVLRVRRKGGQAQANQRFARPAPTGQNI